MMHWFTLRAMALIAGVGWLFPTALEAQVRNIVLVHGMNIDGSTWRPVYDILVSRHYKVTVVQQPLTGLADDVKAVERVIAAQDGPVILVGQSYGGVIVTTAGNDPKVRALVYVAAIQPDAGETMASLNAKMPAAFASDGSVVTPDGFATIREDAFLRDVAEDLPRPTAEFLYASQVPTSVSVYSAVTTAPAWRSKPSFAIVATADRSVNPDLERWMYKRAGSVVVEVPSGHLVHMSHARDVADLIVRAARAAK